MGKHGSDLQGDQKWLLALGDALAPQDPFHPMMGLCPTTWNESDRAETARFFI
jgi:hypothetical protein